MILAARFGIISVMQNVDLTSASLQTALPPQQRIPVTVDSSYSLFSHTGKVHLSHTATFLCFGQDCRPSSIWLSLDNVIFFVTSDIMGPWVLVVV